MILGIMWSMTCNQINCHSNYSLFFLFNSFSSWVLDFISCFFFLKMRFCHSLLFNSVFLLFWNVSFIVLGILGGWSSLFFYYLFKLSLAVDLIFIYVCACVYIYIYISYILNGKSYTMCSELQKHICTLNRCVWLNFLPHIWILILNNIIRILLRCFIPNFFAFFICEIFELLIPILILGLFYKFGLENYLH